MNYPSILGIPILITLLFCDWTHSAPQTRPAQGDYSVTHLDIRDAILSLVSVLRDQMDKLERHEVRERQLGEQLTRSLSAIERRSRGEEKNIENIANYISRLEEKVTILLKKSDDNRLENEARGFEISSVKQMLSDQYFTKSLDKKVDGLAGKFDTLMESWKKGPSAPTELSETIIHELSEIKEAMTRTADLESQLLASKSGGSGNEWQMDMMDSVELQRKQLAVLEEEIGKALSFLGEMTKSAAGMSTALNKLEGEYTEGFSNLENKVSAIVMNGGGGGGGGGTEVGERLGVVQDTLKIGQKHLEASVRETVESLAVKLESGFGQIKEELKGLSNVENVLLDTGDSVLDTKRRLEYGVQQIMGEMNSKLTIHTSNLNNSMQLRFDNLANSVLAMAISNQSQSLTNLTSRMEEEISQVWRQIGLIYHQMSRSANLLDEIHSQTTKYVNNSISMDDKVGLITNQMGEVDDNLNYLLGRMGLVVQEFNMIKGGLGDALNSLKESFVEIQEIEEKVSRTDDEAEQPETENVIEKFAKNSSEES